MKPTIYKIFGFARSGKDTLADWVIKHRNAQKFSFAAKVRKVAKALNVQVKINGKEVEFPYWSGDENCKRFPLVEVGHKLRQIIGQDVWVRALENSLEFQAAQQENKNLVINDCRYTNEKDIKLLPHYEHVNIYIERTGILPQGAEAQSFKEIFEQPDFFDLYVRNDFNSVAEFHEFLKLRNL